MFKIQVFKIILGFGNWNLGFVWKLEFGYWDLEFEDVDSCGA